MRWASRGRKCTAVEGGGGRERGASPRGGSYSAPWTWSKLRNHTTVRGWHPPTNRRFPPPPPRGTPPPNPRSSPSGSEASGGEVLSRDDAALSLRFEAEQASARRIGSSAASTGFKDLAEGGGGGGGQGIHRKRQGRRRSSRATGAGARGRRRGAQEGCREAAGRTRGSARAGGCCCEGNEHARAAGSSVSRFGTLRATWWVCAGWRRAQGAPAAITEARAPGEGAQG